MSWSSLPNSLLGATSCLELKPSLPCTVQCLRTRILFSTFHRCWFRMFNIPVRLFLLFLLYLVLVDHHHGLLSDQARADCCKSRSVLFRAENSCRFFTSIAHKASCLLIGPHCFKSFCFYMARISVISFPSPFIALTTPTLLLCLQKSPWNNISSDFCTVVGFPSLTRCDYWLHVTRV